MTLKHHICDLNGVLIGSNSNGEQVVVNFGRFYFGCQFIRLFELLGLQFKIRQFIELFMVIRLFELTSIQNLLKFKLLNPEH